MEQGNLMNIKNITCILIWTLLLIAAFSVNPVYSGSVSGNEKSDIITVGEGRIKGNNNADARNEAIADALKKGMEEYLSACLGSQGMISYFSILINEVTPMAREEIENFHILAEEKKGEKYSILVRIKVNEKLMEQRLRELGVVTIEATSIKVLFLVSQDKDAGKEISFWWKNPENEPALTTTELKLFNHFQEQGLEPVNRLSNPPVEKYSESLKKPELSNADTMEWGRIFSVGVVIKGKCSVSADNNVLVALEAINVDDGKLISRVSRVERMNPADSGDARFINAVETAVNSIAIELGPEIIKSFRKTNGESTKIQITLKDINNFEEFQLYKKFLEQEIGGIKSVTQSRIKGQSMSILVEYSGAKDAFINKLKSHYKSPFQTDITSEGEDAVVKIEHEIIDPIVNQDGSSQ
jgi:hypothetical protein